MQWQPREAKWKERHRRKGRTRSKCPLEKTWAQHPVSGADDDGSPTRQTKATMGSTWHLAR